MRKFLLAMMAIVGAVNAAESDFITYEWLISKAVETSYTDHIPHWRKLFNNMKVRGFLECGCGFSTKYFLDHADKVVSIEYISPGYGDKCFQDFAAILGENKNWIPLLYNRDLRSNSFNNACAYQCSMHKDYALIDPTYLKELDKHFKSILKEAEKDNWKIDVGFVDPGVYIRGDLVKLLLANKVPVVAAHDTASDNGTDEKENLYGWNKVVTPPDYVKIYIPFGQGTTFWIHKKLPTLIDAMCSYRDAILQIKESRSTPTFDDLTRLGDESNDVQSWIEKRN